MLKGQLHQAKFSLKKKNFLLTNRNKSQVNLGQEMFKKSCPKKSLVFAIDL